MSYKKDKTYKKKKNLVFLFLNRRIVRKSHDSFACKNERTDHDIVLSGHKLFFIRAGKKRVSVCLYGAAEILQKRVGHNRVRLFLQ